MTSHRFAKGALTLVLSAALGGCVTVCVGGPGAPPPPEQGPRHGPGAGADGGPGHDQPPPRDPAFEAALQSCARELGLPPPPPHGRPPGPPPAEAGPDASGAAPAARSPGAKLDAAARPDVARLDACLRGKGVAPPPRRGPPQDGTPAAPPPSSQR